MNMNIDLQDFEKKDVELLVAGSEKVSEEEVEDTLNYDKLSKAEKKAIDEFTEKLDLSDSTQILQFGAAAQEKVSEFSDTILQNVKTRNTGEVGDLLSTLVSQIKAFDKDIQGANNTNVLEKLFSNAKRSFDKIVAKYSTIEKNIGTIEQGLEKDKIQMLKDINIFDTMYEKNLDYFNEIYLYIIAGEKKLHWVKEHE